MTGLPFRSRRGSLLIEVLLTVVVLSVSLNILIGGLLAGYRTTLFNSDYSQAMVILENQMSRLRSQDYQGISVANNFVLGSRRQCHLDSTIKPASLDEGQSLKHLSTVLSWKSGSKSLQIPLSTLFYAK